MTELAEADSLVEQADAIVVSVFVLMGRLVHVGDKQVSDITKKKENLQNC